MTRTQINKEIGFLAHGKLKLADENYRTIVRSISPESGGFVRNIKDDETANLVLLHLRQLSEKTNSVHEVKKQSDQERFIAVLMDYLRWTWGDTAKFIFKITKKHHHTSKCNSSELSDVIRGMIAIIDQDIEKGKIVLAGERKMKYYRYTKHHRKQQETGDRNSTHTNLTGRS